MAKYVGLQSAAAQIRSATGRRLAICNVGRKPSALGSQQLLENAQESRIDIDEVADTLPEHAVSQLNSGNNSLERQASNGMASTSEPTASADTPSGRGSKRATRGRPAKKGSQQDVPPTETVFIGEIPGFGWSEGFMPQFSTEQRPIEPNKKRRGRKKKSEAEVEALMEDMDVSRNLTVHLFYHYWFYFASIMKLYLYQLNMIIIWKLNSQLPLILLCSNLLRN